jgi:hypothetical protein
MPSKYLFLSDLQRTVTGDSGARWVNLPTLSQSSRECYLKVINCNVVFSSTTTNNLLIIKAKIPASNYYSSDNTDVVVAFLHQDAGKLFTIEHDNEISILTNDGSLKNIEFVIEDNFGAVIVLDGDDSMELMIELDYVDQDAMVAGYRAEMPKVL